MLQVKPGARLDLYSDANVDPLFNFQYGLEHPQKSRPGIEMGNVTLSPYRMGDVTFSSYAAPLRGPRRELDAASKFANSVLNSVPCPSALVLDVGIIKGRGWAVVEPNECWGAGIYGCTPSKILEVLLAAVVQRPKATEEDLQWDYARHYFRACPHMKYHQNR